MFIIHFIYGRGCRLRRYNRSLNQTYREVTGKVPLANYDYDWMKKGAFILTSLLSYCCNAADNLDTGNDWKLP